MLLTRKRSAASMGVVAVVAVVVIAVAAVGIYFAIGTGAASTTSSTSSTSAPSSSSTSAPTTTRSTTATTSTTTPTSTTTTATSSSTGTSSSSSTTSTTTSSTSSSSAPAAFPFTLTSNPNTILITPGQNLTYAVIGFILLPSAQTSGTEQVNLSVTAPSGISIKLASSSVKLTIGVQTLPNVGFSMAADQSAAPGDYTINMKGVSGSVTETGTFTIKVVQYLVVEQGNHFGPSALTVKSGSTVYWINLDFPSQDPEVHNVIITSLNVHSPDMSPASTFSTFSYTFTTPGTYQYFCAYHPGMMGTITVTA